MNKKSDNKAMNAPERGARALLGPAIDYNRALEDFLEGEDLPDSDVLALRAAVRGWRSLDELTTIARPDAGKHAKDEIEALAKALEGLPDKWNVAFSNVYLQQYLINEYCGHHIDSVPADQTKHQASLYRLIQMGRELERLQDAVNAVNALRSWNNPVYGVVPKGRAAEPLQYLIIFLTCFGDHRKGWPNQKTNAFIGRVLEEVVRSSLGRKTLGNRISDAREYIATHRCFPEIHG